MTNHTTKANIDQERVESDLWTIFQKIPEAYKMIIKVTFFITEN